MNKRKWRFIYVVIVLIVITTMFGCYYTTNATQAAKQNNDNVERFNVVSVQDNGKTNISIIIDNETNIKYLYVCRVKYTGSGGGVGIGAGLCKLEE